MPLDADTIRAIVREEISGVKPQKPRRKPDKRASLQLALYPDEMAAVDALCATKGCCRSDLLRELLQPVLNRVLLVNRELPANFRRNRNRTKTTHFQDPATDQHARDQAKRRAVETALAAKQAAAAYDAAVGIPAPAIAHGMLSDAAAASVAPKLPRSR